MNKMRILFLCTGNACRSQMAEGWARHIHGDKFQVNSAGIIKQGLDKRAELVMAEAWVNISGQWSKTIDDLPNHDFDVVITLCDSAKESCPYFPGRITRLHKGFDDPPGLAMGATDEERALMPYRRVRDEIKEFVKGLPDILE